MSAIADKIVRFTALFVAAALLIYGAYWAYPVKYAVRVEEFDDYSQFLLVREVHYTGTGWAVVGDSNGYFSDSRMEDVVLTGEELPEAIAPAQYYNTFLCIVNDTGLVEHFAFEEMIGSYEIVDWYPVYPVVRNRLLPPGFFPQRYMTRHDMESY